MSREPKTNSRDLERLVDSKLDKTTRETVNAKPEEPPTGGSLYDWSNVDGRPTLPNGRRAA